MKTEFEVTPEMEPRLEKLRNRLTPLSWLACLAVVVLSLGCDGIERGKQAFESDDYQRAMKILRPLAEKGDPAAQVLVGRMFFDGEGVEKDHVQAIAWFTRAAEQGDPKGQGRLGWCYKDGLGTPRDYRNAARWFQAAADGGNAWAQHQLGHLYKSGDGVPQDYTKAAHWWRQGAERGHVFAQVNLAHLYRLGQGVEQDCVTAYIWYTLSGLDFFEDERQSCSERMTSEEMETAEHRIATWRAKG